MEGLEQEGLSFLVPFMGFMHSGDVETADCHFVEVPPPLADLPVGVGTGQTEYGLLKSSVTVVKSVSSVFEVVKVGRQHY